MFADRSPARNFALVFGVTYLSIAIIESVVGGISGGKLTGPGWIFAGGLPAAPDKHNALNALVIDKGLDINQIFVLKAGLHNIIHWATGLVLLGAFFAGGALAETAAKVFGAVYAVVVIAGLLLPHVIMNLIGYNLDGIPDLSVPISYTIDHAAIAIGGIYAGFLAVRPATATA